MRIRLSAPLATASNGTLVFLISSSLGLSRTGTLRCFSLLAAADAAMGFTGRPVECAASGADLVDCRGIVMVSPHDGHSISVPAPALSTASSCWQLGQSKMMSIIRNGLTGHSD